MPALRTLKPKVTREEALKSFSPGGVRGLFASISRGPLRLLADVYVPFRIYRVEIRNESQRQSLLLGIDAVRGELDTYRFDSIPAETEQIELETRNCLEALLDPARANELVVEKTQRLIFSTGFFRIRNLQIHAQLIPLELHLPYWLGFFGSGERARLVVLDALRRHMEGAKARQLFYDWLAREQTESSSLSGMRYSRT